jgi:hypothetical protein
LDFLRLRTRLVNTRNGGLGLFRMKRGLGRFGLGRFGLEAGRVAVRHGWLGLLVVGFYLGGVTLQFLF